MGAQRYRFFCCGCGANAAAGDREGDEDGDFGAGVLEEKLDKGAEAGPRGLSWAQVEAMTGRFTSAVVGEGGFSTVYLARLSGALAAVKVHRSSERLHRVFRQELETLQRVRHPHIVRLLAFCDRQGGGFYSIRRGRCAGAGVRAEREPARAAPRRGQGRGDDAVGSAGVGGAAGGAGARVPARPLRAAGGARRRQGLQRAPGRVHVRQALRLRVGADGVLRRRPPSVLRAHHARLPGLRRPALHPLGRGHQEERRLQLRRLAPGAPHGDGGLLRRGGPAPDRRPRDTAQGQQPPVLVRRARDGRREARHRIRRRRGRRGGGAGRGLRRREPQPPSVHGRRGAHSGAERSGVHLHRQKEIGRPQEGVSHEGGSRRALRGAQICCIAELLTCGGDVRASHTWRPSIGC